MAGGGSQPINGLKTFKNKTGKLHKFTKPFFCLSIPTARLRIIVMLLSTVFPSPRAIAHMGQTRAFAIDVKKTVHRIFATCTYFLSDETMPIVIDGRMCFPFGARVYQLDSKDPRIAAVTMAIPALLAFAGLITCGTSIAGANILVQTPSDSIAATVDVGFRQMRLTVTSITTFFDQAQTFTIKSACPGAVDICPQLIDPFDTSINPAVCISSSSFSSFAACQVFGAFAICLLLTLPPLIFLNKASSTIFSVSSWSIIVFLVISVCCAVLGCRQIENCQDDLLFPPNSGMSYTRQAFTSTGANSMIFAILFQFFIWT
jgi:hypothetical protein